MLYDPALVPSRHLLPYVRRQSIPWRHFSVPKRERELWTKIASNPGEVDAYEFMASRDAVIVGPTTEHLDAILRDADWGRGQESPDGRFRTWWNPTATSSGM